MFRLIIATLTLQLLRIRRCVSLSCQTKRGINEAAYKALEKSVQATLWIWDKPFDEALQAAVAVDNACSHAVLGVSPFLALFGFYATLPGWHIYWNQDDRVLQRQRQQKYRQQQLIRRTLVISGLSSRRQTYIAVGDWIVHYVGPGLLTSAAKGEGEGSRKYSPHWSLPANLAEVKGKVLIVQDLLSPRVIRQVPRSHVRC